MPELIYSVGKIFSKSNPESCLNEYDVSKYYIGAYQRGYKWDSDENGAVTFLLTDIYTAFQDYKKNYKKEYFLQYITLKRDNVNKYFEVIDGQQRLTTLSLLLSIFALKLKVENITDESIIYEIRDNFLSTFIFNLENLNKFINSKWDDYIGLKIEGYEPINNQDIYYIYSAAIKIDNFLEDKSKELNDFYNFILSNVMLIVNVVSNVTSEKIFSNMNSNKVALTESELIKALLLTRYARENKSDNQSYSFREITEKRISLGRQWDEIANWTNRPSVKNFYFSDKEGMNAILQLVAELKNYKQPEKKDNSFPLFNFYLNNLKTEEAYESLIKVYSLLKNWYNDTNIYNLLGFLFFAKKPDKKLIIYLQLVLNHGKIQSKNELLEILAKDVKDMVPEDTDKLLYGKDTDTEIHRLLLALSVFQEVETRQKFNFYRYNKEKWTLEHIFPQTPEGKDHILDDEDKKIIRELIGDKITEEICQILKLPKRDEDQKSIYETAFKGSIHLNSIGNMCLLTDKDNASNGCLSFLNKRNNILSRIRTGSFVPSHTFEVFSKMILSDPGDPARWTLTNIEEHKDVIYNRIKNIDRYLK